MNEHDKSISIIEQDMARSRAEIGRTTDALKAKIDPDTLSEAARQVITEGSQRVEDKVKKLADTAGERVESLGEQAISYFQSNPIPALMAGMGIGLLIKLAERETYSKAVTSGANSGSNHRAEPSALANHPKLLRAQRRTARQARRFNHKHPVLMGIAALGAGMLLGALLPATRREDELLGPTRDRLVESGKETAQAAIEQVKSAAEQELEKRKAEASAMAQTAEEAAMTAYHEARAEGEEERRDTLPSRLGAPGSSGQSR
jgi:ElaB/YqjD/DUF883 family membrane-anchored ribosome-binding protein